MQYTSNSKPHDKNIATEDNIPYYIQAGTYNAIGATASITFETAYKDVPYVFVSYTTTKASNVVPTVTSRSKTGFTVKKRKCSRLCRF